MAKDLVGYVCRVFEVFFYNKGEFMLGMAFSV